MEGHAHEEHDSDELLRRALIDDGGSAAVALRVEGLPLSHSVTVIFHGRMDIGAIQTYVARGSRGAGSRIGAAEMLRVPCDLDLADAGDRDSAEALYVDQARAMREALEAADTVLAVWREPLEELTETDVDIDHSVELEVSLPAYRVLPAALRAPDRSLVVTPVCGPRTLAAGRPPLGIACAQPDLARVYPLPEDPERCIEDFIDHASEHAQELAERLEHQEASVRRFLQLSGEDFEPTA